MCNTYVNKLKTIKLTLIHKKGDRMKESNYRGIALVNTVTKLLTYIVNNRMKTWIESYNILPEAQSGFRSRRSCIDNLFVINSIVQSCFLTSKKGLYAIFIDFQRAFDSVSHDMIWEKIYHLGISGKITRLLKNIYDEATLQISVNYDQSKEIQITKGVLQGECTSPLLFALFISDLEEFFRKRNLEGYFINHTTDILSLQYADDIVIFAHSPVDIQHKLNALTDYCNILQLKINADKTKILHFHVGRPPKRSLRHTCQTQEIQFVTKYTYLGVTFTSSGSFNENTKGNISKANRITGAIKSTMLKTKIHSWNANVELYSSLLIPVLLYGAEIWGSSQFNNIEKGMTHYFKTLLGWRKTTPNYLIRREAGQINLESIILEKMLRWWYKILVMPEQRFVKICYNRLLALNEKKNTIITEERQMKYNWTRHLQMMLSKSNFNWIWQSQNCLDVKAEIANIGMAYRELLYEADTRRIKNSTYNPFFQSYNTSHNYLSLNIPFNILKIIGQLRTANTSNFCIYQDGTCHKFNKEEICNICNTFAANDLHHFLFQCPIFSPIRDTFISKYILSNSVGIDYMNLLAVLSREKMYDIYNYCKSALRTKAFIMNV